MSIEGILIAASTVGYVVSCGLSFISFARPKSLPRRNVLGIWVTALSTMCLAATLVVYGVRDGRIPVFGAFESLGFYCVALMVCYLLVAIRYGAGGLSVFLAPYAALLSGMAAWRLFLHTPLNLKIHSVWLDFHILTALTGYALFTLACTIAVAYLLQDHNLKHRRFARLSGHLPALETMDRLMQRQIEVGFIVFTIAIALGIRLAHVNHWGVRWLTDPKILATAATWCVYAVLFYLRMVADYHGRKVVLMTIAGFLFMAFTFVTVRLMGVTIHSFSLSASAGGGS